MRTNVNEVSQAVAEAVIRANTVLPPDVLKALRRTKIWWEYVIKRRNSFARG